MERMVCKGFCLVVLLTTLQSGKGEDYLVAVAYKGKDPIVRYSVGETGALVEIQYPHFPHRSTLHLGPFRVHSHRVSYKMKITSDVENAAIVVGGSDKDVNFVVDADGVFSPLPISALGTKYILPSSLAPNSSYLSSFVPFSDYRSVLLIATHNMSTTVQIFLRMDRGSIYFGGYGYSDGDVLPFKLNPYQTLRMFTPYDLNGTVIASEHSIAVYSGIEYASKYTVYDQLLPVKHYGQEYVVAVHDTKLELQIISEHSHVQITFSSGATVSTGERRLYNRSLEGGESLHFTATSPVLVTLSRADGHSSGFTTVPPVHLYVKQRGVWLFGENLNTTVKIVTDRRATVLIKETRLNDLLTWVDIAGSSYKVGTVVQSQSQYYSTSISSDFPFTALSFYNGSIYHIGYKVSADEPVHYTGQSYFVALAGNTRPDNYRPRILATAGETGGQWQVQDPHSGRVWSRRFNPYNTDYFYPKLHKAYSLILVLVVVRDAAVQIKGGINSYTSFSPLPVSVLGTKYVMSSCLPTDDIQRDTTSYISVLVIATHSKKADIDVIFRLDGSVTYDNKTYIDGDTLSIRLDRYQTLSLNSSSDMTRTIVNATDTIAVYSGTYDVRQTLFTTYEQLLPANHHGNEYILAIQDPYFQRTYESALPYQLQVVTDHSDTSIMFDNGSSISVGEDGVYRKQCGNHETFYFNTTRPVMATLCALGIYDYADGLVVVPPVSLYSKLTTQQARGTLQILTDQENNNVDVRQTHNAASTVFSSLVKWKNLSGTTFKVGTLRCGYTILTIRSDSAFGVLGYDVYTMFNGGYSFRTNPDTETSTPDGSGVRINTGGCIHAGGSYNATLIVGVVCGIVIVALLVAFIAYVFYTRRNKMPVTRAAEQGVDAPSTPMNIYAVPDRANGGAAGEASYTGLRFNPRHIDNNIIENTDAYVNFEGKFLHE